jgi:hypothetical protein
MGYDSIDTVVSHIDMGYLFTLGGVTSDCLLVEVFVPSEGRVPSQGLGSITCHKDPMLYDPRTLSFDESQTQAPLKRRAPLKAQISLVTAVFRPLNHRDIIPQLDTSKMLAMS